jgi:hypothetical protein
MPDTPHDPMRNVAHAVAVALTVLGVAACSIRQDGTGVTRTGILLWGFGDPPGVNWNLDRPRREVPELPASRRPELPPRSGIRPWDGPAGSCDRRGSAIGDNRLCVSRNLSEAGCSLAARTLARPLVPDRG